MGQATDQLDEALPQVVDDLLSERLDPEAFERVVNEFWASGRFVRRAPEGVVERVLEATRGRPSAPYGDADDLVTFECERVFGEPGRPGAFHLTGPGEVRSTGRLADKNRAPHAHATGRIAIVTRGSGAFFVGREVDGRDVVVETPLEVGDVVFWPAWSTHTFDAGQGLSILCAMGVMITPDREHYVATPPGGLPDLDRLPRLVAARR